MQTHIPFPHPSGEESPQHGGKIPIRMEEISFIGRKDALC